ncbi:hypothetical protein THAOC_10890 [Thalassiosira oceanica]|uniref:Uncharacterized protein n=1 Tax=Thalassiosira oceanica TaxID=159749 RepID=K0T3L5_THAOC|nr:hypothetical protein THAOC_10890 [Thalassiosira oceanica]|eukprot:EJK67986.1 hypothetical protein THAOC_10890 [Thalassiosira oceanica]
MRVVMLAGLSSCELDVDLNRLDASIGDAGTKLDGVAAPAELNLPWNNRPVLLMTPTYLRDTADPLLASRQGPSRQVRLASAAGASSAVRGGPEGGACSSTDLRGACSPAPLSPPRTAGISLIIAHWQAPPVIPAAGFKLNIFATYSLRAGPAVRSRCGRPQDS